MNNPSKNWYRIVSNDSNLLVSNDYTKEAHQVDIMKNRISYLYCYIFADQKNAFLYHAGVYVLVIPTKDVITRLNLYNTDRILNSNRKKVEQIKNYIINYKFCILDVIEIIRKDELIEFLNFLKNNKIKDVLEADVNGMIDININDSIFIGDFHEIEKVENDKKPISFIDKIKGLFN